MDQPFGLLLLEEETPGLCQTPEFGHNLVEKREGALGA